MPALATKIRDRAWSGLFFCMSSFSTTEKLRKFKDVDLYIRPATSDIFVASEVFYWNDYPLAPRGVVVDLGANIGAFSLFAARTAEKVYAFEPDSSNYAQLLKNIDVNTFSNITAAKKAVGGGSGTVTLYRALANKGSSSVVAKVSGDMEQVEMITLQEVMQQCGIDRIDLLKVDIEGSEYSLFEHASTEVLEKIDQIEMEVHSVRGKQVRDLERRLVEAGFKVQRNKSRIPFSGFEMLFATRG